jgi:hypothetical protein
MTSGSERTGPVAWESLDSETQELFLKDGARLEHQMLADNRLPFSNRFNIPDGMMHLLEQDDRRMVWSAHAIDVWTAKARSLASDVGPPAYPGAADQLYSALRAFPLRDRSVMVAGSTSPWVEAILLAFGVREVATVDYLPPLCDHPRVMTFDAAAAVASPGTFDAIVSFSSIEHDGLGRYGDPIRPDGDIETVRRYLDLVREDGLLFLAVPVGDPELLVWNHHRIYGWKRFTRLIEGWRVVGFVPWQDDVREFRMCFRGNSWQNQPICILQKLREPVIGS